MSSDYLIPMAAGMALGFGLASVTYLGVFIRTMKKLHQDNLEAAKLLAAHQTEGVQKVEEQNMHAVLKRIDALEQKLLEP